MNDLPNTLSSAQRLLQELWREHATVDAEAYNTAIMDAAEAITELFDTTDEDDVLRGISMARDAVTVLIIEAKPNA